MAGEHDRPRSWEVTEGPASRARARDAPRRRVLRGRLRQAAGRRRVVVERGDARATTTWTSSPRSRRRACARAARCRSSSRTIAVSDGIAMGHEGMKASLMSRDLIADSVELVMHAERFDALVGIAGLRQVRAGDADGDGPAEPAGRLPLRRHDPARARTGTATSRSRTCSRPSAPMRKARSTTPSCSRSSAPRVPTTGSCAGMYTANTMAAVGEAIGMSLPGRRLARPPSTTGARCSRARAASRAAELLAAGGPPRGTS